MRPTLETFYTRPAPWREAGRPQKWLSIRYPNTEPGLSEYAAEAWERMVYGGVVVEQGEAE